MNRKQFIKKSLQAGLCTCGAALGLGWSSQNKFKKTTPQNSSPATEGLMLDLERRMIKGSKTPAWRRLEKAELWIKDLMEHMDALLDQETKIKLMQACGRSCFIRAFGVADENEPTSQEQKRYLELLGSRGFEIRREGNVIAFTFNWGRDHQNPTGLIMSDGYCMCPQVETGPPDLSPSYCYCSTGYVKESFERTLGKPVKVELIDSLKMGGKDCIFKVEVEDKK
jgi:hypothetical protein